MNRKTKNTIVLTSLATIMASTLLIAGATYALFTSESKTNIAVTSGKVEVVATVKDFVTYSGSNLSGDVDLDEEKIVATNPQGTFNNGGTATIDNTTGDIVLNNVTPGDRVSFTITVQNNSNVAVKYRTKVCKLEDNGLFESLNVKIDGTSFSGTTKYSTYSNLLPNTNPDDIHVVIDLPSSADNVYQDKTCKIANVVEAIQGNAHVEDATDVSSVTDLATAIEEGSPVSLTSDIDFNDAISVQELATDTTNVPTDVHALTIYGNGKTLSASNATRVVQVNDRTDDFTLTLVDVNIAGKADDGAFRGISAYGNKNLKIVLDNCTVSANHYPLYIADENTNVEIVAKNTTIVGYGAVATYSKNTKATFTNCTLSGVNNWDGSTDDYATICIWSYASNANFTFNKCNILATENKTAKEYFVINYSTTSTLKFMDCSFKYNDTSYDNSDTLLNDVKNNSYGDTTCISIE